MTELIQLLNAQRYFLYHLRYSTPLDRDRIFNLFLLSNIKLAQLLHIDPALLLSMDDISHQVEEITALREMYDAPIKLTAEE